MPEVRGYTSLSIKTDTANRIRECRKRREVTTDELLRTLLDRIEEDE